MSPTSIQPVACSECATVFLPPSNNPDNVTTCPRCARTVRIGDCQPAAAPQMDISRHTWTMESEVRAADRAAARRKQHRIIALIAAVVAAGVALIAGPRMLKFGRGGAEAGHAPNELVEHRAEVEKAYRVAKAAAEGMTATEILPHVREPDRVRPLMEWYYQMRGGQPRRSVTGFDQEMAGIAGDHAVLTMRLLTGAGPLHVLLEQSPDGWKLDWESFSNIHGLRWRKFLGGAADIPGGGAFPVHVERLPVSLLTKSFYEAAGVSADSAPVAVRLFVDDRDRGYAAALLPSDAPLARELLGGLKNDELAKFTLELSLRSAQTYPPCVEVQRIAQPGWNLPPAPLPPP
jgi:hypothetical protein